ncbi:hypothetical protein [Leptospira bandrabouensis]|uniref:Uncharacterized protein n=1 Tax=Leptospira bandrabouensis TaxID=2484903 RepID=A0A6H3NPR3_9LEPT|nr:hypothetical protein [Leptospira bandrabouensis]MCG6154058.1 hypothetical protein [Leptospira bandrabouensis]TGN10306.1 hypothetical protein EHR08_19540 [Leptospira bandrabouensis]
MKIDKKENIAFITSLLALAVGIGDAKNIIENLLLHWILNCISNFINKITGLSFSDETVFSYLYLIILICLYRKYISYSYAYGIEENVLSREKEIEVYKFSQSKLSQLKANLKDKLLNYIFNNKILYYSAFDRLQLAGKIGTNGENIPPAETFDCLNYIIRFSLKKNENIINYEYRYSIKTFKLRARKYIEQRELRFRKFIDIKFRFKKHFFLIIISPSSFFNWILILYLKRFIFFFIFLFILIVNFKN